MPTASFHFPRGFLWGTATAAHQVEGNNTNNNWWKWEQQDGRIEKGHKSGLACDWWGGRWREGLAEPGLAHGVQPSHSGFHCSSMFLLFHDPSTPRARKALRRAKRPRRRCVLTVFTETPRMAPIS